MNMNVPYTKDELYYLTWEIFGSNCHKMKPLVISHMHCVKWSGFVVQVHDELTMQHWPHSCTYPHYILVYGRRDEMTYVQGLLQHLVPKESVKVAWRSYFSYSSHWDEHFLAK